MAWGAWWRSREYRHPIDQRIPPGVRGDRRGERQLLVILFAITSVIVAFAFLSPGSSEARFAVLTWVLMAVAIVTFLILYRTALKVPPLASPTVPQRVNEGGLKRLAATLGRADRGMRFSQVVVARRVRQAFLTRVRHERGLGEKELENLLAQPAALQRLVRDPYLQAFLVDTAPAEEDLIQGRVPGGSGRFRFARRGGFTAGLAQVLEAMEAWH